MRISTGYNPPNESNESNEFFHREGCYGFLARSRRRWEIHGEPLLTSPYVRFTRSRTYGECSPIETFDIGVPSVCEKRHVPLCVFPKSWLSLIGFSA